MENFFKRLFKRKQRVSIDMETAGLDGGSIISVGDIAGIIRDTKNDFNRLTVLLNSMQDAMENVEYGEKCQYEYPLMHVLAARTIHYDVGIGIENLEMIMHQRIPSLKDAKPTIWQETDDIHEI